eukprot:835285_1
MYNTVSILFIIISIFHFANWNCSYRTVALYDTLGPDAVQYVIHHAECVLVFVQKDKLKHLLETIKSCTEEMRMELRIKYIVQYDYQKKYNNTHEKVNEEDKQTASQLGCSLMGVTELFEKGEDELSDCVPSSDDLAYIMYTSGTTGNPKGVMLSHKCFASALGSLVRTLSQRDLEFTTSDSHVSFLPLAHIFESIVQLACVHGGSKIAFFNGNLKKIADDWKEIEPSLMFGVPRIFNKTYDKIQLKLAAVGGIKKRLFDRALAVSSKLIRQNKRSAFYDKIMWSKVVDQCGFKKVRFCVSGAAPLPPHVAEFLRIVMKGAVVLQGYGLTETCAVSFVVDAEDINLGHVGIPVDNVEWRLIDAPECEYYVTDKPYPRGEIQMRGPSIMDGYFKNTEATDGVLSTQTKWFSTGDIGRLNPNGTVSIIDRRKNMFKTSSGEYIAAEKCECVYAKAESVGQIWIYGNSFKSFVVAVIVPDAMWLVPRLIEKGKWKDEALTPATPKYCDKFKDIVSNNYDLVKDIIHDNLLLVNHFGNSNITD